VNKLEEVKKIIQATIPDAIIHASDMVGDMDHLHLELVVASDAFCG